MIACRLSANCSLRYPLAFPSDVRASLSINRDIYLRMEMELAYRRLKKHSRRQNQEHTKLRPDGCGWLNNVTTEKLASSNKKTETERKNSEESLREKEFQVFFVDLSVPRTLVVRVTTSKLTLAKAALRHRPCVLLLMFFFRW